MTTDHATSSPSTLPLTVKNTGFLLDRLGQDCHPLQFLRELTQNSVEAIQKAGGQGEIVWDVDWVNYELSSLYKLCIVDNGVGMTGEEMVRYINQLSSSAGEQSLTGNYGVGAKIAAATRNHAGVTYLSWKNGEGSMIILWRDPKTGIYGLKQFLHSEGRYEYYLPIEDSVKPTLIEDHGTMVMLCGNTDDENTIRAPKGAPGPSRWIAKYLNTRYFEIPEGITIKAREGWEHPREDSGRNKLRAIVGQKSYLTQHSDHSGSQQLTDAVVHWWILRDEKALTQESNYIESAGHVAALYKGELYELQAGRAGTARLQEFGVIFGCRQVVLYVEPRPADLRGLTTNTSRTQLLMDSEALPWSDWAAEFRESMPKAIEDFVNEKGAHTQDKDHTKSIRERLKSILDLYKIARYRPSENGRFQLDDEALSMGGGANEERKTTSSTSTSGGGKGGKLGNVYVLFEKKGGPQGEQVKPDVFPRVDWVTTKDGTREQGDMEDRAAKYLQSQNRLLVNSDFRGFEEMIQHCRKEYGDKRAAEGTVEEVVKAWFEQALVETVIGIQGLRNSRLWTGQDVERALSTEALTAAVMQRYHIYNSIKRDLGSRLGKRPNQA